MICIGCAEQGLEQWLGDGSITNGLLVIDEMITGHNMDGRATMDGDKTVEKQIPGSGLKLGTLLVKSSGGSLATMKDGSMTKSSGGSLATMKDGSMILRPGGIPRLGTRLVLGAMQTGVGVTGTLGRDGLSMVNGKIAMSRNLGMTVRL